MDEENSVIYYFLRRRRGDFIRLWVLDNNPDWVPLSDRVNSVWNVITNACGGVEPGGPTIIIPHPEFDTPTRRAAARYKGIAFSKKLPETLLPKIENLFGKPVVGKEDQISVALKSYYDNVDLHKQYLNDDVRRLVITVPPEQVDTNTINVTNGFEDFRVRIINAMNRARVPQNVWG